MPVERSSQQASSEPAPFAERSHSMGFPHEISQFAVQYVLRQCGDELGHITPADVSEVADRVVAGVLAMQVTPTAVIDTRAQSPLGRGLLDAMREEVLTRWKAHGIGEGQLP